MATLTYTDELVVEICWCGMHHAVPRQLRDYQQRAHDNGGNVPSIYCPLGHIHVPAGKGRAALERERREALEAQLRHERDQHDAERKAHNATKGQLTKARKRAKGGACPCCNRTFVQLARHIASKHPGFVAEKS